MKELREIIEDGLKANGYDGLYVPGECACIIGEIMPCDEPRTDCMAGYLQKADPATGFDFMIGSEKTEDNEFAPGDTLKAMGKY